MRKSRIASAWQLGASCGESVTRTTSSDTNQTHNWGGVVRLSRLASFLSARLVPLDRYLRGWIKVMRLFRCLSLRPPDRSDTNDTNCPTIYLSATTEFQALPPLRARSSAGAECPRVEAEVDVAFEHVSYSTHPSRPGARESALHRGPRGEYVEFPNLCFVDTLELTASRIQCSQTKTRRDRTDTRGIRARHADAFRIN